MDWIEMLLVLFLPSMVVWEMHLRHKRQMEEKHEWFKLQMAVCEQLSMYCEIVNERDKQLNSRLKLLELRLANEAHKKHV